MSFTSFRSFAMRFALVGMPVFSAAAQQAVVSGVVLDQATRSPVAGVVISVSDMPGVLTDSTGRFRITDVPPGIRTLIATRRGYRMFAQEVTVQNADIALTIEMTRQAVVLPRTTVTARNVTIKGVVRDSATGRPLQQASVTLFPGQRNAGTLSGRFSFDNVGAGEPVTLLVEAVEHLPVSIEIVPGRDTSVTLLLGIDSVGQRLIAEQSRRLAQRTVDIPLAVDALNRDALERTGEQQLGMVLRHRLPYEVLRNRPPENVELPCVFLDDRSSHLGLVASLPVEIVERLEIYGRFGTMIRVYTKPYVASLMGEPTLPPINLFSGGRAPLCY